MPQYPLVGLGAITNEDTDVVELFGVIYFAFTFDPLVNDSLHLAGEILARNVAGTALVPYVAAAVDSTGVPVAVLGSDAQADGSATDIELRAIVSGQVRQEKLHTVLAPTVAITPVDADRLRSTGIVPQVTKQLANVDNPQP